MNTHLNIPYGGVVFGAEYLKSWDEQKWNIQRGWLSESEKGVC